VTTWRFIVTVIFAPSRSPESARVKVAVAGNAVKDIEVIVALIPES
jgi:hypothetical protein